MVRVYFDTCCLMRPFDDQSVPRVRLETLAISDLMEYVQKRRMHWVAGKAVYLEVMACPFLNRREKVLDWLNGVTVWQDDSSAIARLARKFVARGLHEWDARHLATAESAECNWFLTTDLELIKRAGKLAKLSVRVANPAEFIMEDAP